MRFVFLAICLCVVSAHHHLAVFPVATPSAAMIVEIEGLVDHDHEEVIGLDYRPANGLIYIVTDVGRIYTVSATTGAASLVSTATCSLSGEKFGINFNPAVDRMRIVSDSGYNYRVDVTSGNCTVDGRVAYAKGDTHDDGNKPSVTAVAYTNNFVGALSTTLYAIDNKIRNLVTINPPNNGTLLTVGTMTPLTTSDEIAGFDIATPSLSTNASISYLLVNTNKASSLYSIDLATGVVSNARAIGNLTGLVGVSVSLDNTQGVAYYDADAGAATALVPLVAFLVLAIASIMF